MPLDPARHPCFNREARHRFARIHLPVAPACNVQCNFCDRKYDCPNESRPGVTSTILTPQQALHYLREVRQRVERVSVVGIAGPGDPFANPDETLETMKLVRQEDPEILLCVASNGLAIGPHLDQLQELEVSHVTVTVNAVDPAVGQRIYSWMRDGRRVIRGRAAAELLLERQLEAIRGLAARDMLVKVNTILIPGVNDHHVPEVARVVAEAGAHMLNCMPLCPVPGTPFGALPQPGGQLLADVRSKAKTHLPQMQHCARCRADAAGLIGEPMQEQVVHCLLQAALQPRNPSEQRPFVAVATWEGVLVNRHLGEVDELAIYRLSEDQARCELVAERPTPAPGQGIDRWIALAEALHDCRAVLVSGVGGTPRRALQERGVRVVLTEGLVEDAVRAVFTGQPAPPPRKVYRCGEVCSGNGQGCG